MSIWETAARKWQAMKPLAIALGVGLLAGPFISNAMGWQVTAGASTVRARADVVEQRAMICAAKARAEMPDTSKLDWSARSDLAKKMAVVPGFPDQDSEIARACADKLAA